MKNKEHLPILGVGPLYVLTIIIITAIAIILDFLKVLDTGKFQILQIPFTIIGVILIIEGIILLFMANFDSNLTENIKNNNLITTGVYAYVRNPIYSAFLLICSGVLLFRFNLCLLILPFIFWIYLSLLMKNTEEKWLKERYGQEYYVYCQNVNRCIPFFRKK